MIESLPLIIAEAIGSFAGSVIGSFYATRWLWRREFVTREEALEMARAIDSQRRVLESLREELNR